MNNLEKITETCNYVYENSEHVFINKDKISELIKTNNFTVSPHWLSTNPFNLLDLNIEEIVNFLIKYDCINYSYWGSPKWTINTRLGDLDGSFAFMYALLELYNLKGHLNFEKISFEEFSKYLKGNITLPLLEERYLTIKEVSKTINTKMNSNFYNYTKSVTNDIDLFNIIIKEFQSFEDVRFYKNKKIYFYKLAQLVTSDILHIRNLKENINFDLSHLVGCADYKIPQVLRSYGILEYSQDLSNLVDNKCEIKENSSYEIEIRANMIKSLELIKKELNTDINLIDVNDIIWSLGQDKSRKMKPYHLTRTTNY